MQDQDATISLNFLMPVVCITCYGRSGSVLLHGLLDNHPQVIAAPSHALTTLQEFLMAADYTDIPTLVNTIIRTYPALFSETDQTPYLRAAAATKIGVARKAFEHNLMQVLMAEAKSRGTIDTKPEVVLRAIHFAYHAALGRNIGEAKVIVWQKHTPFSDDKLRSWLGKNIRNMRFLVPVRRPEVALSAHYAAKIDPTFPSKNIEAWQLIAQLRRGGSVGPIAAPVTGAVRFEDMHTEPEKVTRAIAAFLGIDWHPNMLEPTVDGKELLFPKGTGVIRGFNPDVSRTQKAPHLHWFDKLRLEAANYAAYQRWGYRTCIRTPRQRALITFIARLMPMRMTLTAHFSDLKLLLKDPKTAFARVKLRNQKTRQSLKLLKDMNDGATPHSIIKLIYDISDPSAKNLR